MPYGRIRGSVSGTGAIEHDLLTEREPGSDVEQRFPLTPPRFKCRGPYSGLAEQVRTNRSDPVS